MPVGCQHTLVETLQTPALRIFDVARVIGSQTLNLRARAFFHILAAHTTTE